MRIVQVLAVLSPDNVYGGPATVALDQCRALAAAGHQVVLLAGSMGYEPPLPTELSGVQVRLFPVRTAVPGTGFAGLVAPGLWTWLLRNGRSADAIHVHLARDLITLPAAALLQRLGRRVFVQTHGMVDASDSALAKGLDAALTRRVLRRAARVFALTPAEADDLHEVAGPEVRTAVLPNGIDAGELPGMKAPDQPLVLFLARLAPRKQPMVFVQAALLLAKEFPEARFRLVGPDEGAGDDVSAAIAAADLGVRLEWVGPAGREECARHMAEASVYVLPSVNEPFGMTVLEAMRAGTPPIVTDTCELGPMLTETRAGLVSGPDAEGVAARVRELLSDPALRATMGHRARAVVEQRFSIDAVARILAGEYNRR